MSEQVLKDIRETCRKEYNIYMGLFSILALRIGVCGFDGSYIVSLNAVSTNYENLIASVKMNAYRLYGE